MKHASNPKAMFLFAASAAALSISISSGSALADDEQSTADMRSKAEIGLAIAPVVLNLAGKNRQLVGLGSFIVNGTSACNDCHTGSPQLEYSAGGNPYFGQPKTVNPAVYLGGGYDFGPLIPGSAHIVSRNLTPDRTGRPIGGRTYGEFAQIIRTGVDLDHLHPTCAGAAEPTCVPSPFDGSLLQIMPWPAFRTMTDDDLTAIYEYLSAIPCVAGPPAPSILHNDCD